MRVVFISVNTHPKSGEEGEARPDEYSLPGNSWVALLDLIKLGDAYTDVKFDWIGWNAFRADKKITTQFEVEIMEAALDSVYDRTFERESQHCLVKGDPSDPDHCVTAEEVADFQGFLEMCGGFTAKWSAGSV